MEALRNFQVAEIELSYRSKVDVKDRPLIKYAADCYELLLKNWDMTKIELVEQSKIIFLNRASQAIGMYELSSGGTTGTVIDIKLIMVTALKINASRMIISHNHPSGTLKPSAGDLNITRKLVSAGKLLDIQVDDHIIITTDGFYSLAEHGDL